MMKNTGPRPPAETPVIRSFSPIYDENARVLILGTMASPASLRAGMYYGHPRNAFWRILADLTGDPLPADNNRKRALLLRHGIALWDTLEQCERPGAADGNIRREKPNDVAGLVRRCPGLRAVFLNGSAAYGYYLRYHAGHIPLPFYRLPSTSPANARGGYECKREAWAVLAPYLPE